MSASQDVVIDAYRTDLLPPRERGLGSSLNVLGYRLAMILSGGVALIWTDPTQGGGWDWPQVYRFMAGLMVGAAVLSAMALPRLAMPDSSPPRRATTCWASSRCWRRWRWAMCSRDRFGPPLAQALLGPLAGRHLAGRRR